MSSVPLTADSTDFAADSTLITADATLVFTRDEGIPVFKQLADYLSLLAREHADKPKLLATLSATLTPFLGAQTLLSSLPRAFDLDQAIGVQLDAVGERVGISRNIKVPIPNLFFSFGDARKGFGKGYWKGPYDSTSGISRLDDDTYRTLIRAKIAANDWDGTTESAQHILDPVFAGNGTLLSVYDNQDMSMTVAISGAIPPLLILALIGAGYLPLKPQGVRAKYAVTTVNGTPVFGFGASNEYVGGFGQGSWGRDPSYFTA